jgi:hypothetical protein
MAEIQCYKRGGNELMFPVFGVLQLRSEARRDDETADRLMERREE